MFSQPVHRRQSYFSTYMCLFNCQRKNKKLIYVNICRNTINDGDSQMSPLPIFPEGGRTSVHRLLLQPRLGRDSASPCLPVHSLVTSFYTLIKLQCRSSVGLCLEGLHAINDALAKHLEYENTQKRIVTFFFSIWPFKKRNEPKCFKPVLNWLTVRYAPASNLSFNFLNHISLSLYGLLNGQFQCRHTTLLSKNGC